MLKRNLLCLSLFLISSFCDASQFDFNANCQNAYREILSLKLNKGEELLAAEKKTNPANLIPVLLENYIDFFRIFVSGDEKLFEQLSGNKDKRLELLKRGDKNSPYFLYAQAEINLQWALANLRFRNYVSAVFELRRAYKLLEENMKNFPDFQANKKSLATIKALLGTIPSTYSWGISLLGMEGNLKAGMEQLDMLLKETNKNFIFRDEVINIYASLLFHLEGKSEEAWQVLQKENYPLENNLFSYYTTAKIAVYGRHNDEAVETLAHLPSGKDYEPFPQLDYFKGLASLHRLETNAHIYFERFAEKSKGKELIKSAYQKAAWSYLVDGKTVQYNVSMQKVKEHGSTDAEADQQAQREAEGSLPDIDLLKARLLFDGGYFEKAIEILQNKKPEDYRDFKKQLELVYRKGRIYDELQQDNLAISNYQKTIEMGAEYPYYYAANAALCLGLLYEKKGDRGKAKQYFNQCLSLDEHEYKNSLNGKAKAGLERLKE